MKILFFKKSLDITSNVVYETHSTAVYGGFKFFPPRERDGYLVIIKGYLSSVSP